MPAAFLTVLPK